MEQTITRSEELQVLCHKFRINLIELLHSIQTGHPGGSLSAVEILTKLYFDVMAVDSQNPKWEDRDRFILGKGHAAPMLYMILAEKGFFPKEELKTLRQANSRLQGHPCVLETPGVETSTGPLGLGLPVAVGMATGAKMDHKDHKVYILLGDGEIQEGIIWEAAMVASKYKLDNLIAILDNNGVQLDGTVEEIMPLGDISAKWRAFGWHVIEAEGHNLEDLDRAFNEAKAIKNKPICIIAKTVKGKGVSFMEGQNIWHGKPIELEHYAKAMTELGGAQNGSK